MWGAGEAGLLSVSLMVWKDERRPGLSLECFFLACFCSKLLSPWTRKKASTVGWRTSTAWVSCVSARASRQLLRAHHRSSKSNFSLSGCLDTGAPPALVLSSVGAKEEEVRLDGPGCWSRLLLPPSPGCSAPPVEVMVSWTSLPAKEKKKTF